MIDGEKKQRKRLVKGKKYEFIASHTFRRTFCTLYFGKMKNQDIMKISGHKKESEFLKYIGKKDVDYSVWDSEL
jgi:integrase